MKLKLEGQIEMVTLMRKSFRRERVVWRKYGNEKTSEACRIYAEACTNVLESLRELKKLRG